jgi:hypothetical protein
MAAGLGFKNFTSGEVLTAADVNGYLMQGVGVFTDAANRDAEITSPQEGQFAYLKDTNVTTYYTGSAWANLDTTGMANPMTTTGDTIYSSSGSTPARLGIGTSGQVLSVSAGLPAWTTPASSAPASGVASVLTRQSTNSNTYTDLATSGPAVTLTTGTKVLVIVSSAMDTNNSSDAPAAMDFAVSGATTRSATDQTAVKSPKVNASSTQQFRASSAQIITVTAGSNTFTAKYHTTSSEIVFFENRTITVIDLGS